mgnify:CR=1 FL=1
MKQSFNEIKKIAFETDTNCCTVISASVVFEKDYQETHAFFKARGRKNGKGIGWQALDKVYKELGELEGFKVTLFKLQYLKNNLWGFVDDEGNALCMMKTKGAITINNFRDYLPKGDYVLGIYKHVVGVKNGTIQDWTANYQRNKREGTAKSRVFEIWKMEKKNKVFKELKKSKYDFSKFI